MNITVIIPAAGRSTRFNQASSDPVGRSKIEHDLAGKPIFLRSIELFLNRPQVGTILLAVNPDELDAFRLRWGDQLGFHGVELIPGGKVERWETVQLSLKRLPADATHVAVHDAARPLTPAAVIDRVLAAAERYDAVVPALAVAGTLKRVSGEPAASDQAPPDPLDAILGTSGQPVVEAQRVIETVSRENLVEAQTPQVFRRELIERAYARFEQGRLSGEAPANITDDASLIEALGKPVHTVEGGPMNFKITRQADLELADLLLRSRQERTAASLAKKRLFGDDDDD